MKNAFENLIDSGANIVDKSLFIEEIIQDATFVTLITRPTHFGKTVNLSMLRTFFEKKSENKAHYFEYLKIYKSSCFQHQGKYPVIYLDLNALVATSYEEIFKKFKELIANIYTSYKDILFSGILENNKDEKILFQNIIAKTADQVDIKWALKKLSEYLDRQYDIPCIVLVDGFDVPLQKGHTHGYSKEIEKFLGIVFGCLLKTNSHVKRAILMGAFPISNTELNSRLNNVTRHTILDKKYSQYFDFRAKMKEMPQIWPEIVSSLAAQYQPLYSQVLNKGEFTRGVSNINPPGPG